MVEISAENNHPFEIYPMANYKFVIEDCAVEDPPQLPGYLNQNCPRAV